jgi:hypothetical protein
LASAIISAATSFSRHEGPVLPTSTAFASRRAKLIIDQDDVGRLQRAHRAQRKQLGIAGARADQGHAAGAGGRDLVLGRAQKCIEIGRRGFALRIVHRKARERLPEPPPGG